MDLSRRPKRQGFVRIALQRPHTFVVMALLIAVLGLGSIATIPTDIFPAINSPVVSVIWTHNGTSPDDMAHRIVNDLLSSILQLGIDSNTIDRDATRRLRAKLYPDRFILGAGVGSNSKSTATVSQLRRRTSERTSRGYIAQYMAFLRY